MKHRVRHQCFPAPCKRARTHILRVWTFRVELARPYLGPIIWRDQWHFEGAVPMQPPEVQDAFLNLAPLVCLEAWILQKGFRQNKAPGEVEPDASDWRLHRVRGCRAGGMDLGAKDLLVSFAMLRVVMIETGGQVFATQIFDAFREDADEVHQEVVPLPGRNRCILVEIGPSRNSLAPSDVRMKNGMLGENAPWPIERPCAHRGERDVLDIVKSVVAPATLAIPLRNRSGSKKRRGDTIDLDCLGLSQTWRRQKCLGKDEQPHTIQLYSGAPRIEEAPPRRLKAGGFIHCNMPRKVP